MFKWYREILEETRKPAATAILQQLGRSERYLGFEELMRLAGQNRGMTLHALKSLHNKGLIQSSTGKWSAIQASSGASTFGITAEGKKMLGA